MPGNFHSIPLWQIATWPAPSADPVRRTWLPGYAITLQVISTVLVAMRLWLRGTKRAGTLGLDDLLLIPTWLASVGYTACCMVFMKYGGDRHVWDIPAEYFVPAVKNAWIAQVVYLISTTCVKVSVLLFYQRLAIGTYNKRWKYATICAIVFTIAYAVAFMGVLLFGCRPLDAYWLAYDVDYLLNEDFYCVNGGQANLWAGILSVFSDVYAVLLPCLMLRRLDAPRRQKIALNIIFSCGLLVVIAGCVRTYYFNGLAYTLDETWLGFDIFVWATLELQLAIICASAPALRVFFQRYLSDPIGRAVDKTKTIGSAITQRSANRASIVSHGTVQFSSDHNRNLSDVKSMQHHETVYEVTEITTAPTPYYTTAEKREEAQTSEHSLIKSPQDYERYAAQNLEKNRPFARPYFRPASETSNYEPDPPFF